MHANGRVFVTDGVIRRALAIARALGRSGVTVTCGEETALNPTFFSRYCHHRFKYPSPRRNPGEFVPVLLDYLEKNPHDCLMPAEQDTLDIILQNRHEFERLTAVPFVDNETYQVFRDKGKTLDVAERAGVPYPRTVRPSDPGRVVEETKSLRFPVVVKPRFNWASRGIRHVQDATQLAQAYREVHQVFPFPLVQEEIPLGEKKYHVNCILDENSRPIVANVHRELRNYPLEYGISTVQESVWRPDLVELSVQLLQANNWYGIASIDYMIDPRDGTPMLMEVNPRFWGTIQLAIHCGLNYPYMLYQLARGEKIEPVKTYPVGVINRSFLPYDILHFLVNPHRFQMEPSFFDFFGPQVHFDLLSRQDWKPVLGFFMTCLRYMADPEVWTRLAHMERVGRWIARLSGKSVNPVTPNEAIANIELSTADACSTDRHSIT